MASRLALKYGLVSEQDRLPSSPDAILVTEPTTGSKARTKGSLYLVVTSRTTGNRMRDACRLVADTIRREYYYDESAGIAIVLEKAIRAASRRLRQSREGSGLQPGAIGICLAVVRSNELYVASIGDADSYLIRSARLLMPEHESGSGVPAPDALKVDVWRGEFSVGDSLVLCSRNLVEVVGTEELKNAVVTLHPQSAVEHLHHLFVAAGGEGSDAVLAIEATEVSLSRVEHRLVPVSPSEPLADEPERSPIPLADQFAGAATAVQDRAVAARVALGDSFTRAVSGLLDLMPHRRTSYRRMTTSASRRENQRRAAIALLAFICLLAVLGVALWAWGPLRPESPISRVTEGEAAFAEASQKAAEVFGRADLVRTNPAQAERLLQGAWDDLNRAATAEVDPGAITELRGQVADGLDELYGTVQVRSTQVYAAPPGAEIRAAVRGPDNAAYMIVGQAVIRADEAGGGVSTIAQVGFGGGQGLAEPVLLSRGGSELLIVDAAGALWRWRPSDAQGSGTLGQIRVSGDQAWGADVVDVATFLINPDQSLYRLYVPYPATGQILRYDPTADGSGFSPPTPYFVSEGEDVGSFRQLHIDGDVYAVTSANLLRYFNGRRTGFELQVPPDDGDVRPGHDYALMAASGTRGVGRLYMWDRLHQRICVFDKTDGAWVEQFVAAEGAPQLADVRGMYLVDRGEVQPPIVVWATATGLFTTVLSADAEVLPTATPNIVPSLPVTTDQPVPTGSPTETSSPTPEPTERPRRTPQTAPATP